MYYITFVEISQTIQKQLGFKVELITLVAVIQPFRFKTNYIMHSLFNKGIHLLLYIKFVGNKKLTYIYFQDVCNPIQYRNRRLHLISGIQIGHVESLSKPICQFRLADAFCLQYLFYSIHIRILLSDGYKVTKFYLVYFCFSKESANFANRTRVV